MTNYKNVFYAGNKGMRYRLNGMLNALDQADLIQNNIVRSATIVIAASDSTDTLKDQADFVCDGTADNVEIQGAIDTVAGYGGGSIFITKGTYVSTSLVMKDNVRLIIDSGTSGISYSVADGISCVVEDYATGIVEVYEEGAITNQIKAIIEKPRLQVQVDSVYYYPYPVRTMAGHFTCAGSKVQGFPVFIVNPSGGNGLLYRMYNGNLEQLATITAATYGQATVAWPNRVGGWVIWSPDSTAVADAYKVGKAYYFASAAQITASNPLSTLADCRRPHECTGITSTTTGRSYPDNYYHMWGEYTIEPLPENLRIMRAKASGAFEAVLTVPTTHIRHFHSMDGDPYNPGTFYATTGDDDPNVWVYKSTDYGDTWTEIAGGSQLFRTLHLNFDANYIYWAVDGYYDGYCRFVRASRNDYANPEILFTFPTNQINYGTVRTFSPPGVLIPTRSGWTGEPTPYGIVYFYSFNTGKMYKILEAKAVNALGSVGFQYIPPYQNEQDGLIYMQSIGIDRIYTDLGGITSIMSGIRITE